MLNGELKREALAKLNSANQKYQKTAANVTQQAAKLYEVRKLTAQQIIQSCEDYINTLANSPKEFDKSVSEFKVEYAKFTKVVEQINVDSDKAAVVSGSLAGAGAAAGVGVAAFGPTTAIAIATTFGTASTGTAISALSGAAAANAALAWLGGGALVAGGGGMAAGNALLAMAGPVGWAIGGTALAGSALLARGKNAEIAQKANREAAKIKSKTAALKAAREEIAKLLALTQKHANGVNTDLNCLQSDAPDNYLHFSAEQKLKLAALINNIQSLSKLLNQKLS